MFCLEAPAHSHFSLRVRLSDDRFIFFLTFSSKISNLCTNMKNQNANYCDTIRHQPILVPDSPTSSQLFPLLCYKHNRIPHPFLKTWRALRQIFFFFLALHVTCIIHIGWMHWISRNIFDVVSPRDKVFFFFIIGLLIVYFEDNTCLSIKNLVLKCEALPQNREQVTLWVKWVFGIIVKNTLSVSIWIKFWYQNQVHTAPTFWDMTICEFLWKCDFEKISL